VGAVIRPGLLAPGERKSVEPMASRVAPDNVAQLHHFVAASPWDCGPIEDVLAALAAKANALIGGEKAHLIIDDTALPKKGELSVGVAPQYCGALGKQANCQVLVSTTLARDEIPVALGLKGKICRSSASGRRRRALANSCHCCKSAPSPSSLCRHCQNFRTSSCSTSCRCPPGSNR
jgi:hypothetical protein